MPPFLTETLVIMGLGLLGAVLPVLPGPPLVWLGAMYYSWRTNWTEITWPTLVLLFVLAAIGSTADWWMAYLGARRTGASIWASLASVVGGIVGMLLFSIPGAILGALGAIALVEYQIHRDWDKVLHAGSGYMVGYLLSMVVEIAVCLLTIGLFFLALYA